MARHRRRKREERRKANHRRYRNQHRKVKFCSPKDKGWLSDRRIEHVFFLDQCIEMSLNKRELDRLMPGIKVVPFPRSLWGIPDEQVLVAVMNFLVDHSILLERSLRIYLYTSDEKFVESSHSKEVFEAYDFSIDIFIFHLSEMLVREMNVEASRSPSQK